MRSGAASLLAWLILVPAIAGADEWTRIDVRAHLENDGRATVTETHFIVFEATDKKLFHEFGLAADQAIALARVTRIGPGPAEQPLAAVETVDRPDQYRYYDRGHVYYSVPPLGERVALAYRFEYELIGAVTPAWAIAAGPGSRAPGDLAFAGPWNRALDVYRDLRRAWPAPATRYRYDHDVLLPDRDGSGHEFRQIDYRLEYDSAWEDTDAEHDVGDATPDRRAFRAAVLLNYLGSGRPARATTAQAATRWLAIAAMPLIGVLGWALVVGIERFRGGGIVDRAFVDTRFVTHAPEEIASWMHGVRPSAEGVLNRLATEGAIAIQLDRVARRTDDEDDEDQLRVHMRRVAPDATLAPFERTVLDGLFGGARELTPESHEARHRGGSYDPQEAVDDAMRDAVRTKAKASWNAATIGLLAVMAWAIVRLFGHLGVGRDIEPAAGIVVFVVVALVTGWPAAWWHAGRPVRGLLVPLVLLFAIALGWLLTPNRPLPSEAWIAMAAMVLAGYFVTLVRSRVPRGQGGALADLVRMRRFAAGELRRPRPQLEDRWIPRLQALGLGGAIEAWRTRHGGAFAAPPELGGGGPIVTTATFTGRTPAPWAGPDGWTEVLYVDDEERTEGEAAEEREEEEA
jgi:hypothetical protein